MSDARFTPPSKEEAAALMELKNFITPFMEIMPQFPASYIALLLAVAKKPGLSVSDYAKMTGMQQAVASRALLEIGQKSRTGGPGLGWIDSVTDRQDLRRRLLYLTPTGRAFLSALLK